MTDTKQTSRGKEEICGEKHWAIGAVWTCEKPKGHTDAHKLEIAYDAPL